MADPAVGSGNINVNLGGGMGTSHSQSKSQSTSTPEVMQSPQSQFELQLAGLLQNIGQGQYDWATNQFNNAQGVTDQQIDNYINNANSSLAQSNSLWNQYNSEFAPIMSQYAQKAQSYASPERINFNMGQAESTAGQAADQAAKNAQEQLMSFGVNPSSGMYGELADAQQAARAASQASAGTEAGLQTQEQGNQMLLNSAEMGQQLPSQSVNAMNAAYQGIAGAENSILGLENTGVNLMDSANPYFNTAMQMKLPPVANATQSSSESTSSGTTPARVGGGWGGSGNQSQPLVGLVPPGTTVQEGSPANYGLPDSSSSGSGSGQNSIDPNFTGSPYSSGDSGNSSYDASSLSDQTYTPDYNMSGGGTSYDANSAYGGGYARGGGVLPDNATTGGYVPSSASPSRGANTDDIPARLNAKEFVIPRDVVEWKGSEFFKKLIEQSRKARGLPPQPIGGQPKPPLPGRPSFTSRPIQGRAA